MLSHLCKQTALLGALTLGTTLALAPRPADACGGTFCDAGPQSMPVDQSGENILFILDGEEVEVHIQIQYQGDPEKFAWVIPLTGIPSFSIGSEALFQNLLAGSVPSYGFTTSREQCPTFDPPNNGSGFGDGGQGLPAGGDADDGGESGPTVVHRETLGAYEIAVLEGGEADEVIAWLDDNGYQQDPDAEPIIREYLAEGNLFGAIKLTGGAGVEQIHPIVLRYRSDEPCVPLRLTRIAAVEDMEIRTFFLGDSRMVPSNYRHVLVNPLKIDWLALASNYKQVITGAVDADHANGRAFVTEYAGPSGTVDPSGLHQLEWDPEAFRSLEASELADELGAQGLAFCSGGCQFAHPLIASVVTEFVTLPAGVTLEQFLDCAECYADAEWDSEGFADAFDQRIVTPGEHAEDLLRRWPYLTRMYTTISPHEMTEDPIFHARDDFGDVAAARIGNRLNRCSGDTVFTLPDGREVFIPGGRSWPTFPDEMPWEEEVSEIPVSGAPMVLSNRTAEIDALLEAYNIAAGYEQDGCGGCQLPGPDSPDGRWPLGLAMLLVGAGVASRRRRH